MDPLNKFIYWDHFKIDTKFIYFPKEQLNLKPQDPIKCMASVEHYSIAYQRVNVSVFVCVLEIRSFVQGYLDIVVQTAAKLV